MNTIKGETLQLDQLDDSVFLVNFWATDCLPCIKEIPHLTELHHKFNPKGLRIISISMYYDLPIMIDRIARQYNIPYDIVLDPSAQLASVYGDISLTPQHFLITAKGHEIEHGLGSIDFAALQNKLEDYLQGE